MDTVKQNSVSGDYSLNSSLNVGNNSNVFSTNDVKDERDLNSLRRRNTSQK